MSIIIKSWRFIKKLFLPNDKNIDADKYIEIPKEYWNTVEPKDLEDYYMGRKDHIRFDLSKIKKEAE